MNDTELARVLVAVNVHIHELGQLQLIGAISALADREAATGGGEFALAANVVAMTVAYLNAVASVGLDFEPPLA